MKIRISKKVCQPISPLKVNSHKSFVLIVEYFVVQKYDVEEDSTHWTEDTCSEHNISDLYRVLENIRLKRSITVWYPTIQSVNSLSWNKHLPIHERN